MEKLKNTSNPTTFLMGNQGVKEKIKKEIRKYLETNENKNTTHLNLWNEAKAGLTGKFIAIKDYIKKKKSFNKQPNLYHFNLALS